MSRCLVMAEREVSESERAGYLQSLVVRRNSAAAASAHFWVFEDASTRGRFLEFVEAGSEQALRAAVSATQPRPASSSTDLREMSAESAVVWMEIPDLS